MTSAGDGLGEAEFEVLPPLNPLSTTHNHLYSSKPSKPSRFSFIENSDGDKAKRRASRQVKAAPEPSRSDSVIMKRRTSRLGMFGLFNRNKNAEFQNADIPMATPLEEEETSDVQVEQTPLDIDTAINPPAPPPVKDESDLDPTLAALRRRASKRALKTKDSFIRSKPKCWEPPPLFQAYPQSVKHATLSTPVMPAEALIRLNLDKQQKLLDQSKSAEQPEPNKKLKEKKLRKSQAFELANNRDWTPKVFAVVTEGYLLQYAGQGSHDRLPEKILPLCKQSAAFATDVIRGKPFVLQISQTSGEDGMIDTDISKELLKKANLKSEIKRSASAFLLVLGSPEEMNEWLVAVRKEIENHGGKEYRPEFFGTDGTSNQQVTTERKTAQALQRVPSQRYLVKRDPFRFSPKPPDSPRFPPPPEEKAPEQPKAQPQAIKGLGLSATNRYSFATSDSTNPRYQSDTTASIDQAQLDRLRETPRQSYMSTDAKTASTSRCSSMERSPVLGRQNAILEHETSEHQRHSHPALKPHPKPSLPQVVTPDSATATPKAISEFPTPTGKASPPPTPNFSVPIFSKRYSATPTARSTSQASQISPINNIDNARKSSVDARPPSNSSASHSSQKQDSRPASQRYWSGESDNRPQSAGSDARWSRRNSSLNYTRGISPLHHSRHSPSPHPPPTIALPPLPPGARQAATKGVPAPTAAPPPPPSMPMSVSVPTPDFNQSLPLAKAPRDDVVELAKPVESKILPTVPTAAKSQPEKARKLRRPVSMQVRRRPPTPPNTHHAVTGSHDFDSSTRQSKTRHPLVSSSEFKRVVAPLPSAPPPSPKLASKRYSAKHEERTSHASATTNPFPINNSEPHAYIPPISLSDRRSGLSLDGPWNNTNFTLP